MAIEKTCVPSPVCACGHFFAQTLYMYTLTRPGHMSDACTCRWHGRGVAVWG
jgi:hypothetical protein